MSFNGRAAVILQNDRVRVSVLKEGGHVAEILHKQTGVNPLWVPPWRSIEPSQYSPDEHPEYGLNNESKLLAGIAGHNLCLDVFGPVSDAEAAAGVGVHGEASVIPYEFEQGESKLRMSGQLPLAGLHFTREISLDGETLNFHETVENLSASDRPIAWTQHVTLGPPFLNNRTLFDIPAIQSRTFENASFDGGVMAVATEFQWPRMPLSDGGTVDLRCFHTAESFSRFTTHLMNAASEWSGFAAYSASDRILFGYRWRTSDFPWLGLWQENRKRDLKPWDGRTVTCGMEFGVSPYPETRKQMIERGKLFGVPAYKWLPARGKAEAVYSAFVRDADSLPPEAWR